MDPLPSRLGRLIPSSLLALSALTGTSAQTDNGNECSCFKTNGSSAAYFTYHRFHDFRNINSSLTANPDVLTDASSTTNADVTSEYFEAAPWTSDWDIQSWNNSDVMGDNSATVLMINSANNIYIGTPTLPLLAYTLFVRDFD
jgi:hypothetical protein